MNFENKIKVSKWKELPVAIESRFNDVIMECQHFQRWITMVLTSITATAINTAGLILC